MKYVLASGSPRRKVLLKEVLSDFEIITADIDERPIEEQIENELAGMQNPGLASIVSMELSKAKAMAVFKAMGEPEDTLVIGADTCVAVSDEIMGKPVDRDDAVRMLRKLSMEPQYVITGVSFITKDRTYSFAEESVVTFNPLDAAQEDRIQRYCDTPEPYDKAGAYGLQDQSDSLVKGWSGDFNNIVGLPTDRIRKELEVFFMNKPTDNYIDAHKDEMIEDLRGILRIRSLENLEESAPGAPFGSEVDKCLNTALKTAEKLGFKASSLDGYCGIIDEGQGEELFGVLCHIDVVPEGEGWIYPPYAAEIHDGKIYARGALDDKGPAIAAMYALKAVKESGYEFRRRVRIILGANEETGMKCLKYYKEHAEIPTLSISPDAEFPVTNSEKSIMHATYKKAYKSGLKMKIGDAANIVPGKAKAEACGKTYACEGFQTHASIPETGKNAMQMLLLELAKAGIEGEDGRIIGILADGFKMDMHGESLGLDFTDDSGRLTLNPGVLKWDENGFELTLDLRIPNSLEEAAVNKALDALFDKIGGVEKIYYSYSKGFYMPEDTELVSKLMDAYIARTGDTEAKPMRIGGGTYARYLPNAVSFGPDGYMCGSSCHVANEFMGVDQLVFNAKLLADAIISLACK